MAKVEKFEDLIIFQKARELCKEVYNATDNKQWKYDVRFMHQVHAAVGSIMDNIAEGFERDGNKEFKNFLYIAKGSCGEVRSQVIRATDLGYIDTATSQKLYNDCIVLNKSIATFIKSLRDSKLTGMKYMESESLKPET